MQHIIEPTRSQEKFLLDEESKAIAFITGFGGGKSFIACVRMIEMKMKYPQCDILYLFPTFSMFRDILFPTLSEVLLNTGIEYRINKSTGEIFFACGGRIILKSMDNADTIVGFNVLSVFLDELDTMTTSKAKAAWVKAIARARKKVQKIDHEGNKVFDGDGNIIYAKNQMLVVSTPEGYRFIYNMFEKKKPDNYTLIQAKGLENIHLPEDYYENLEQIYTKEQIEAYRDGKFVNLTSGAVYTEFDYRECNCESVYREGETLIIGMDFNVRNCNGVVYVKRNDLDTHNSRNKVDANYRYFKKPQLHAIHHFHDIADTEEMTEVIRNRYPNSPIIVYPDSSGKNASSKGITLSDITILKGAGFTCRYPSKNPRVLDRVKSYNSALKVGLVKVNMEACPEVAESLLQQVYNENTQLPDKKANSKIDDVNDAATYPIDYIYPIKRKSIHSVGISNY